MPSFKDSKGTSHFSMNPQVAKAKFGSMGSGSPKEKGGEMTTGHGSSATFLHSHGDGSYHTEHGEGGERTEHPSLGHALMHMAHHHEPGGKHMHIHSEGGMHSMHHVDENGDNQGPHDHDNLDDVKNTMDQFLGGDSSQDNNGSGENDQESSGSDSSHLME